MQQKTRVALNYVEITSSFEISFIHCASSLRRPAALPRAPFPLCFPFPRLYIFGDCVSSSAATSGIRKNDVPDDATPVFGTDPYCQLLLAPISAGSRESYEVPFGRSREDSHISSSPYEFCFNFRVSHLEVGSFQTNVRLFREIMLIIRELEHSYPRDSVSNLTTTEKNPG